MPLRYEIDVEQKLVIARAWGVLTYEEVIAHRGDLWLRLEARGLDEVFDVSEVERFDITPGWRVRKIAACSAARDTERASRLALVAPQPVAFGLARMYQSYSYAEPKCTKEVGIFHTFVEAMQWIAKRRACAITRRTSVRGTPETRISHPPV